MSRKTHRFIAPLFAAAILAISGCGWPAATLADEPPPGCASDRTTCILEAIDQLDPGANAHWTKTGKPKVGALETVAGFDITGAERDEVWTVYEEWKAKRRELENLKTALASVTAERDRRADHARGLQAQIAGWRAELESARAAAAHAADDAVAAEQRARTAENKVRALSSGGPVCAAERAVAGADDSWLAKGLRPKVDALLRCLD